MQEIDKKISPFIESQFPSFYKEDGPQFIAFIKAYYEFLEQSNNVIGQSRNLTTYRDIDTTLDEFIVHFKEKYLKNIQFDTATNKVLLVKNALDLYRSKGTERSIDLFFKLVYGTPAEIRYPAENILRASDGIWERPQYIEISYSKYNVDYVGKQIVGSISGSTAFVEKYIRRKTNLGYTNILYISDITKDFVNGEVLGITIDDKPTYDINKRAKLLGSIKEIIVQNKGQLFKIGDPVNLSGSLKGIGGSARVDSIEDATGIVDFNLINGGYGYTLSSNSIISEKVASLSNVVSQNISNAYFKLFEDLVQPTVNATFDSASSNLSIGDTITRYSNNNPVSVGSIIKLSQSSNSGSITVSHISGAFTNNSLYYTTGNVESFYVSSIEDRSISGQIMGIPNTYKIYITDQTGNISIGQEVYQANSQNKFASGYITEIEKSAAGNTITIQSAIGAFKKTSLTGDQLLISGNNTIANIDSISLNAGIFNIRKNVNVYGYVSSNNDNIINTNYIYQYSANGALSAKALVVTGTLSSNSGNLSIIPIRGYFSETKRIYTDSNTSSATLSTKNNILSGGDFIASPYSKVFTQNTLTSFILDSTSYGSGASFKVGSIGDTETIFINTDIIGSNNSGYINYNRAVVNITANTGFSIGDTVYQQYNKIAFNSLSAINKTTGFISILTANTKFSNGDIVKYVTSSGNTTIKELCNNNSYYVVSSNSTGVILSNPYRKSVPLNTVNYPNFANGVISEVGHYLFKESAGSVYSVGSGVMNLNDIYGSFKVSGGTANTTVYSNSNIMLYSNSLVNTSILSLNTTSIVSVANNPYASLSIRSNAYGFPKNKQGNYKDTIYSLLNFKSFTIGSVGSLTQIDPGIDYNVDPYTLVYQPYVSAFNRKDFIIEIKDSTNQFVVGEKINQTSANLIYYDLKVSTGVFGNTYNETVSPINAKIDVDSSNDFIYISDTKINFNSNTNVDSSLDFINIAGNIYENNDLVRYYTSTGNTVISGLSNNALYYVVSSNTVGIKLSSTSGGAALAINATAISETGHIISRYLNNVYSDNMTLIYKVPASNTVISGLSNNTLYYVVSSNTVGIKLSSTSGGAALNLTASASNEEHYVSTIPGYLPGDKVYQRINSTFNSNTSVNSSLDFISITPQNYSNNDLVRYYTSTGNTVISGLSNNTSYYVSSANSTGIKLSSTSGGAALAINATAISETGHNIESISNSTIHSVYTTGSNNFVRVYGVTNTLANNNLLYSYTNPYLNGNVNLISTVSIVSTAKGIVKSSNSSVIKVKRLSFENTFIPGQLIIGDISGSTANVVSVSQEYDVLPIGLNANVTANVITANGQVSTLQIIDSGFGYSNSEIIKFTSADGDRSGSGKVIISGSGIGKGYYKSNKGFLSSDMYIQDGDYYQEYSYEILSKMSFDKYTDMFKKVMHMAGTKFFGSALIIEEANVESTLEENYDMYEASFNASTSVNSSLDTIDINIEKYNRAFNPITVNNDIINLNSNPFANNDLVRYYTSTGNTVISGLSNNSLYYVVNSNNSSIQLSTLAGGSVIDLDVSLSPSEFGHNIKSYVNPFANNDLVRYYTSTGNTVISGLSNNSVYIVKDTTQKTIKLANTINNIIINITNGSSEIGHYLNKVIEE